MVLIDGAAAWPSEWDCCQLTTCFNLSCAGSSIMLQCCGHAGPGCAAIGHVWCSRASAPAPSPVVLPQGVLAPGSHNADDRAHANCGTNQLGFHCKYSGLGYCLQQHRSPATILYHQLLPGRPPYDIQNSTATACLQHGQRCSSTCHMR